MKWILAAGFSMVACLGSAHADLCSEVAPAIGFLDGTNKDFPLGDFSIRQSENACEASDSVFGTRRIECLWDNPDVPLFDKADAAEMSVALNACPQLTLMETRDEGDYVEYDLKTPRGRTIVLAWDEDGMFLESRE